MYICMHKDYMYGIHIHIDYMCVYVYVYSTYNIARQMFIIIFLLMSLSLLSLF